MWILRPRGTPTSLVVFGHGWSTPEPTSAFAPWIAHLRARGSIVVYPRYRTATTSITGALAAFEVGVRAALTRIRPLRVPVVAVGKSFGGSAVFYYAASARDWGVPAPSAVLSIFPAGPVGALPPRPLPARTQVEIFVGDADTTAGSGGANAFWAWLSGHARRRYVVVRSRPGFVANHDSAQRSDAIARAVFWAPLDRLIAQARH
ncbi:MAG: hypothetical protein ACXVZ4_06055 [Gaiellaceae bacterium]